MASAADYWTIVTTAALSVFGTLGVTYFGHRLGLSRETRLRQEELDRHARYLAIRVVCELDTFVSRCCDVVHDDGFPDQEGGMHPQVAIPKISFPDDVDWKSIEPELMYRLLSFPIELDRASLSIDFVWRELAYPPDFSEFYEERTMQFGRLGLSALALADDMRRTFSIPMRDFGEQSPKNRLECAIAEVEKQREELRAGQRELFNDLAAGPTSPTEARPHQEQ